MRSLYDYISHQYLTENADLTPVNIVIGRFQPFTLGHLKCAEYAYTTTGLDTVLMVIDTVRADERHPFLTKDIAPFMESMTRNHDNHIIDVITVKSADIVKMSELCRDHGYLISAWTCGTDRIESYTVMSDRYKEKAQLPDTFVMVEVPRTDEDISATRVRNVIRADHYDEYASLVPKEWTGKTVFKKLQRWIQNV